MKPSAHHSPALRFGVFEVDLRAGELRRNGRRLRLQEKPFQLLAMLLERAGEVVSKEELQQRLWPDVSVDADGGLNEAVYKLRLALDDSAQAPRYVETIPKRGYRFVAAVDAAGGPPGTPVAVSRWKLAALVVGSAAAAAAGTYLLTGHERIEVPQRRFSYAVEKLTVDARTQPVVAISPDGTKLVFGADHALWVQQLDQLWNPRKLPGTESEGVVIPAWSTDSTHLAFVKDRQVFRLDVRGGPPTMLAPFPEPGIPGAVWSADGHSIFVSVQRTASAVHWWRTAAVGGRLEPAAQWSTLPSRPHLFWAAGGPHALGEGGDMLYRNKIVVWDRSEGAVSELGYGRLPQYSSTGHVVYQRHDDKAGIWAMPFSRERAKPTGEAFPVAPGGMSPTVSADGTLVYAAIPEDYDRLLLLDRKGRTIRPIGDRQRYIAYPSVSPDGKRVAVWGFGHATDEDWMVDIWIHDVDRPTKTRLTEHPKVDLYPQWTPDGRKVSFSSDRTNRRDVYRRAVDSSSPAELLWGGEDGGGWLSDWSSDGTKGLVSSRSDDLWIVDVEAQSSEPLLATDFREEIGAFSPDDRYIAFTSNRSGRNDVYVCSIVSCGENIWKVSTGGGYQVRWKGNGAVYYVEGHSRMMEVKISTQPELTIGDPVLLFESPNLWLPGSSRVSFFDVTEDGERFVVVEPARARTTKESPGVIHVWQNWAAAFEGAQ